VAFGRGGSEGGFGVVVEGEAVRVVLTAAALRRRNIASPRTFGKRNMVFNQIGACEHLSVLQGTNAGKEYQRYRTISPPSPQG